MDNCSAAITTYPVAGNKQPVLDLDADEYGHFIAISQERIWTNARQLPVRQSFRSPLIRELDQERFLIIEARQGLGHNAHIFDWSGDKLRSFDVGSAEDVIVQAERIVVSYFDQSVLSGRKPACDGLAVFDFNGQQLFGFNSTQQYFLLDCYAMCKLGNDSILAYTYTDFPLLEIRLTDYRLIQQPTPADFAGAHALTTSYGNVVFYASYNDKTSFFWWNRKDKVQRFGHQPPARLRGIGAGKFLTFDATSFTIIDAMELMRQQARR